MLFIRRQICYYTGSSRKIIYCIGKFVKSVERIAAVISASFPTPGLLKRLNEIVPFEDGAEILTFSRS